MRSRHKSDTTIARTWTEQGDKCAEQPMASIQNYAELRKKQDGIKLNTLYQPTITIVCISFNQRIHFPKDSSHMRGGPSQQIQ
jgi:hypothetical protein